jgi:putative transposase
MLNQTRLISLSDGKVRFTWKDHRANGKTKVMMLAADEFIRRFLLHTLPDGFHRIRHYGFLANVSNLAWRFPERRAATTPC